MHFEEITTILIFEMMSRINACPKKEKPRSTNEGNRTVEEKGQMLSSKHIILLCILFENLDCWK